MEQGTRSERAARWIGLAVLGVIATAGSANPAGAADARLAWRPVAGAAGYRVYLRQGGQGFAGGIDVGLPAQGTDGLLRYVAAGLPAGVTSYLAVTVYASSGAESGLSNEIALAVPSGSAATPPPTQTPTRAVTSTATRPPVPTQTPTMKATQAATPTATGFARHNVSGRIRYYGNSSAVPAANVVVSGPWGSGAATTDALGNYRVEAAAYGSWRLEPAKAGDLRGAVSALDAARILHAVTGTRPLTAIEALTCDVTGNGSLTALDANRVLQFTVGAIARLPVAEMCGSDFVFVPEPSSPTATRVIPPLLANDSCRPGGIGIEPLTADTAQQDFTAAVFGDCTGNWSAAPGSAGLRRDAQRPTAYVGKPRRGRKTRWKVPVYVQTAHPFDALEIHADFDPGLTTFADVQPVGRVRRALIGHHADASGQLGVALASAKPLQVRNRPVAFLIFEATGAPHVELLDALVNDEPAILR